MTRKSQTPLAYSCFWAITTLNTSIAILCIATNQPLAIFLGLALLLPLFAYIANKNQDLWALTGASIIPIILFVTAMIYFNIVLSGITDTEKLPEQMRESTSPIPRKVPNSVNQ